jgi:hypothetical protein
MTLRECDGQDVAVVVALQGESRTLRGTATYLADLTLGSCLSVQIDEPNSSGIDLLLREDEWTGRITPGESQGCFAIIYLDQKCSPQ